MLRRTLYRGSRPAEEEAERRAAAAANFTEKKSAGEKNMPKSMMLTLLQHTQRRTKSACYALLVHILRIYTIV